MKWLWVTVNIEVFPAPFTSTYWWLTVSLCSAHISPFLLNLMEINPLCQPSNQRGSKCERGNWQREEEEERKAVKGKD